ncbi:hypothetical protein PSI22_00500 [Xenorhabdus sp. XENO-7]|uniref:Uncharacterized protein n=1 Tax=Xenorhabdus aichiensis TaxID=3025874 RepID=A0ABT5LXI2_9GAMM|nr:hypothetical protein [Xenorhabdus aichiensis]MDC9620144.1 hypothetical protein [Xenorhabdus aichiensis]
MGGGLGGAGSGVVSVYVTNWPANLGGKGNQSGGVIGGGGKNKLIKTGMGAGIAGMLTGAVTPYVDDALTWAFGNNEQFNKIRSAPTWGEFYDATAGDAWSAITSPIKDWSKQRDEKIKNEGVKPSPYLTGERPNSFGTWPDSPANRLAAARQVPETPPAKPADGKITVVVESSDDLKVRTKSVQAENVDLRVNTGYSYGRSY